MNGKSRQSTWKKKRKIKKAPLSARYPNFTRCKFQKECSRTLAHKLVMHFSLEIYTSSRTLASILRQGADQICLSIFTLDLVFHRTMNTYCQFHHHRSRTPPEQSISSTHWLFLKNSCDYNTSVLIFNHHYSWKPSLDMNQYRAVPSRKFFRFIS